MAKQAKIEVRLDDDVLERWKDGAVAAGLTLSMFVRQCVEDTLAGGGGEGGAATRDQATRVAPAASVEYPLDPQLRSTGVSRAPTKRTKVPPPVKKGKRTSMCAHRRGPDEYCARCDG